MDELLDALAAGEEANFSLFNYVNDLSGEVDKLEEGIGGLRWAAGWRGAWRAGMGSLWWGGSHTRSVPTT